MARSFIFLLGEEGKEDERIVLHRSNRAVLFDAKQWHYADAPERGYSGLRISLAYKLWI